VAGRPETAADQRGSREGRVEHGGVAAAPPASGEGDDGLRLGDEETEGAGEERRAAHGSDCEYGRTAASRGRRRSDAVSLPV